MTMTTDRRSLRDSPFKYESERRQTEKMQEDGNMPKDLSGLNSWYKRKVWEEIPTELHTSKVYIDRVTPGEAEQGIKPVGASDSGALAYGDEFRRILENSASEVDHQDGGTDGRVPYLRPIASALSRMARQGKPLTARVLMSLAGNGFDWVALGTTMGFPDEMWRMYLKEALVCLWLEHRDFTRAG